MSKSILIFVIGCALGAGVTGFSLGIFIYPYMFHPDAAKIEAGDDLASKKLLATGTFIPANPEDLVHYGKGQVSIYEDVIHFEKNFEVGAGPEFHVYLVPEKKVALDASIIKSMYIDIGRLKAFKGSQKYSIPDGVELTDYGSVVIWCEEFGKLIAPAELRFRG